MSTEFKKGVGVIIPNYNGDDFIIKSVRSAVDSLESSGLAGRVYVVDDASEDDSLALLENNFTSHSRVTLIKKHRNTGFREACEAGLQTGTHQATLFLNSDVVVDTDSIKRMMDELFKPANDKVFAVTGNYVNPDGTFPYSTLSRCRMHMGLLRIRYTDDPLFRQKKTVHFFANGGFSLFKTELFLRFGGFDPIFKPFYSEDVHLSLVAAGNGYNAFYLPDATGFHEHSRTIKKTYSSEQIKIYSMTNRILLAWIHLDHPILWLRHFLSMILRLLGSVISLNGVFLKSFYNASLRLGEVREVRNRIAARKFSLREILGRTSQWFTETR